MKALKPEGFLTSFLLFVEVVISEPLFTLALWLFIQCYKSRDKHDKENGSGIYCKDVVKK